MTKMWTRTFAQKLLTFESRIFTVAQTDRQTKESKKKNYYIKKSVTKKKSQESCVTNMNCDKKNYLKGLVTQVFLGKPFFVGTLKKVYIYIFLENF